MTTFGGSTIPPLFRRDEFPTFSNTPFVYADAQVNFIGDALINLFWTWNGGSNTLENSVDGIFPVGLQYTIFRPGQNPGPAVFFTKWVADIGTDPADSFFPAMGVLVDINGPNNVGITRPAVGTTKDMTIVMQGIDSDMITILAQAKYRIVYTRP